MTSDVEHLFMYLLAFCISFFGKMSIQDFCPSFNWIIWFFHYGFFVLGGIFGYWVVWVLHIFWIITPYQISGLQIFFSHSMVAFLLCWFFLLLKKLFSFMSSNLFIFAFGDISKKSLPRPMSRNFFPMFSSRSFMVQVPCLSLQFIFS